MSGCQPDLKPAYNPMANLELRSFSQKDFKELISWIRNPEELFIWSATTFTFPLDENQLERHFQEAQTAKPRLMYTAQDGQTKEHVGHIELTRIDQENKKISIAYVLINPSKRGDGYGKALMKSILNECFDEMKMRKVDLFVFESNTVAIHIYQKMGFEFAELIKDRIQRNGEYAPLYLMELDFEKWIHST
jgi:RimJ/RimL family protein N-acetyltransferase